jgi:hypothetical protein
MTTKHTPAPWYVKAGNVAVYGYSEEGEVLVVVYELGTNEADIRLISAAPDLLEALKVIVDNGGIGPESMFDDARAAIKKAEAT